jgi:solute carrier family 15 (peptide/histidine transporter), member 3/4
LPIDRSPTPPTTRHDTTPPGGWLADTYLGRFRCIALFSSVYLMGLLLLILAVWPAGPASDAASSSALIFGAIYLVALGDGGIKPNVCTFILHTTHHHHHHHHQNNQPTNQTNKQTNKQQNQTINQPTGTFGADQFDRRRPEERRELESFFACFYWAINIGALISFTLVASICQFGVPWLGGKEYRFVAGFSIPALATVAAIAIFLAGAPRYKKRPPKGSILTTASRVVVEAAWASLRGRRGSGSSGSGGGAAALLEDEEGMARGGAPPPPITSWLDRAKAVHGGSFAEADVEGVKYVWRLLPFLFFLMPYWVRTLRALCCLTD